MPAMPAGIMMQGQLMRPQQHGMMVEAPIPHMGPMAPSMGPMVSTMGPIVSTMGPMVPHSIAIPVTQCVVRPAGMPIMTMPGMHPMPGGHMGAPMAPIQIGGVPVANGE